MLTRVNVHQQVQRFPMPDLPLAEAQNVFAEHFAEVTDPRVEPRKEHRLIDIIGLTVCAVICGADGLAAIEDYGKAKREWLRRFLALENGIPSHDTIGRVFARLDPEEVEASFRGWIQTIFEKTDGEVVAIDGKTLRRSYEHASDKKSALHMVSAWAAENPLTLGQVKTSDKSNELTAIARLLELLDGSGCLVSIDAMGCQKEIAKQLTGQGADSVLALKGNQGELLAETKALFDRLGELDDQHKSVHGDHGRVEIRRCRVIGAGGQGPARYRRMAGASDGLPGRVRRPCERRNDDGNALFYQQPRSRCGGASQGGAYALAYREQAALGARCRLARGRQSYSLRSCGREHGRCAPHGIGPAQKRDDKLSWP